MAAGDGFRSLVDIVREEGKRLIPAGYSIKVTLEDELTMVVRLLPVDVLADAFPVEQGVAMEPSTSKDPASVPQEEKRAPGAPRRTGFSGVCLDSSCSCAGVDQERLQKAISSFPDIFTQTKPGKGVWYSTCLQLHRLSEGTFMAMDQFWDQAWLRKMRNKWGIPGVIQEGMGCTEAAISAVIECCNYIRKMREDSGNYWWPPMKNGMPQKMSMYEFLHTLKRNHCAYSPFIEVYGEMMATRGMAASIPGQVKAIAGDIRAASTFLSSLGISGRLMYWDGVLKFCQWYWARRDALMAIQQNRCRVHTIAAMAGLAKAWAESSGNRCMPLRFIHPEAAAWASFVRWLKMERGVVIPREAW